MYSTTYVASAAIDFAKGNVEEEAIDSPPSCSIGLYFKVFTLANALKCTYPSNIVVLQGINVRHRGSQRERSRPL
jgi:hypothetical protein